MRMRVSAIDLLPEKVSVARHNVEDALVSSAYKSSPTTNEVNALNALSIQEGDYHDLRELLGNNELDAVYTIETLAHETDLPRVLDEFCNSVGFSGQADGLRCTSMIIRVVVVPAGVGMMKMTWTWPRCIDYGVSIRALVNSPNNQAKRTV